MSRYWKPKTKTHRCKKCGKQGQMTVKVSKGVNYCFKCYKKVENVQND